MRLGIVTMGTGAYAAAGAGVLRALDERRITPFAVCGMQFGALIALEHLRQSDGCGMRLSIEAAARSGKKLLKPGCRSAELLSGKRCALCDGRELSRILFLQGGERPLALYDRRAIFPCRTAVGGRRIVFSTGSYVQGAGVMLSMQATAAFAARAAMGCPPFFSPVTHMGACLLPEDDPSFAADQLLRMGADRVLIVDPCASASHEPDALELAYGCRCVAAGEMLPTHARALRIVMPPHIGALGFERMALFEHAGYEAAKQRLDQTFESMGMTLCRILPFSSRVTEITHRGRR